MLILISNEGQNIKVAETNFWDTPLAREKGGFYLSGNAGALRLLVPDSRVSCLSEMQTGKRVEIVKSIVQANAVDVVFEDGSASPFYVALDKKAQTDRALQPGRNIPFTVWTRRGKELELRALVK
jgi:hypothetical protein